MLPIVNDEFEETKLFEGKESEGKLNTVNLESPQLSLHKLATIQKMANNLGFIQVSFT